VERLSDRVAALVRQTEALQSREEALRSARRTAPSWAPPPAYRRTVPRMDEARRPPLRDQPYPRPAAQPETSSGEDREQPSRQVEDRSPEVKEAGPTPIEEIRASLKEFREAVRDLAESRARPRG
jgi:hypothetical protein